MSLSLKGAKMSSLADKIVSAEEARLAEESKKKETKSSKKK